MACAAFGEQQVTDKVRLKSLFQPGKSYVYSQKIDGVMEMKNPLAEGNMKISQDMGVDYTCIAKEHEKGVKVEMSIDKMTMKSGSDAIAMIDFDSSKEASEGDPFASAFQPVLDMECFMIYDKEGNPLEFGGLGEMPGAEQMGMDSQMFEQMLSSSHDLMPENPVAVGDSWESEQEVPMGKMAPSLKLAINSKLESVEELDGHKVAKVSYVADMNANKDSEDGDASLSIKTKTFKGTYWHDLEENITRKSEVTMEIVIGVPKGVDVKKNGLGEMPYKMDLVVDLVEIK